MNKSKTNVGTLLIFILSIPFIVLLILVVLPFYLIRGIYLLNVGLWLRYQFYTKWNKNGKFILFIYSESPNWQEYIEKNILPKIDDCTVTLNWSNRNEWRKNNPLEAKIFKHWASDHDYNPIAFIIPRWGRIKIVPFWQAFRDYKHGKDRLLRQKEAELFQFKDNFIGVRRQLTSGSS
jgi:hypothetical protein